MNCKYATYSDDLDSVGRQYLYCRIMKDTCPLVRYCDKVNKLINNDFYENCRYYIMENGKVKKGFSRVRFEKHGKLYVEVENTVVTFDNPYDEVPKEVEIIKVNNTYYIKGTEPKEVKKSQPKKKEKQLDDIEKELLS